MKAIVNIIFAISMLICTSCALKPSHRELQKPPNAVLDEIPSRFDRLEQGMTESEILDTLGFSPYALYMSYFALVDGGIGGFTHSWEFGSGYNLRIRHYAEETTLLFSSPQLNSPLEKNLGRPKKQED